MEKGILICLKLARYSLGASNSSKQVHFPPKRTFKYNEKLSSSVQQLYFNTSRLIGYVSHLDLTNAGDLQATPQLRATH